MATNEEEKYPNIIRKFRNIHIHVLYVSEKQDRKKS